MGGVKGLLNNVKKNCTFLTRRLPLPISPSVVIEHHLKQMAHNVLHPYSPLCMVLPFANLILLYHPSKVKQQTHQTCKRVITFCFWTYLGSNIIHLQKLKTKCHKSYQDSDKSKKILSFHLEKLVGFIGCR